LAISSVGPHRRDGWVAQAKALTPAEADRLGSSGARAGLTARPRVKILKARRHA
jgi:hypothetical protein